MNKKRIISVLLGFIMALSMLGMPSQKADAMRFYGSCVYNCSTYAPLKKSASGSSTTIARIPYGKSVIWLYGTNKKNGYYKVSYGSKTGWLNAKYCTWTGNGLCGYLIRNRQKTTTKIALKASKSSGARTITSIPKSAIVFGKTSSSGKWTYVNYKTKKGYVLTKYLKYY